MSDRSNLIGVILRTGGTTSANASFYETITSLSRRFAEHDIDLMVQVASDGDEIAPYRRLVRRKIIDGFVLNSPVPGDPRVSYLRECGVPFVVHGRTDIRDADYAFVDIDNRRAGSDALSLLFDLEHWRVALLNGPAQLSYAIERLEGFREMHELRGIDFDETLVFHGEQSESYGYVAALSALARGQAGAPTAFICASTIVAAGALRAIADRGLACPGDISIIAHDDVLPGVSASTFSPALTVTYAPLDDACAPLADHLIRLLDEERPTALQTTVPARLIVRHSTAMPPAEILCR